MFHAKDGWCFSRKENGDVLIAHYPMGNPMADPDQSILADCAVTIPMTVWASVVAHMSAAGDTPDSWGAALLFHTTQTPETAFPDAFPSDKEKRQRTMLWLKTLGYTVIEPDSAEGV